jgi:hypothetical protein
MPDQADVSQLTSLLSGWTAIVQGLVASVGGLAFALAFLWKIVATEPRSVMEAKRWIGRIVFGTLGVELATTLAQILISGSKLHH